jgi:hypothetical protein
VLVKEKRIDASGIISRRVATVPNLGGIEHGQLYVTEVVQPTRKYVGGRMLQADSHAEGMSPCHKSPVAPRPFWVDAR